MKNKFFISMQQLSEPVKKIFNQFFYMVLYLLYLSVQFDLQFSKFKYQNIKMEQTKKQLKQTLKQIKKTSAKNIQQDFYQFMLKAKDKLGQNTYLMAEFYYQYGNFILQKQQSNLDLFNQQPAKNSKQQKDKDEQQKVKQNEGQQQGSEINLNILQNIIGLHLEQANNKKEKSSQQPQKQQAEKQNQEAEDDEQSSESIYDDKDICALNLQMAIDLYEEQLAKINNGQSTTNKDEVLDGLRKTRTRLGDLYLNDQDYKTSVEHYQKVIELQSQRQGFECNRFITQLHYLIGNAYLYTNEQENEGQAINEFIKAIETLLNYLKIKLNYDISKFDIPTATKIKVQRTQYLPAKGDTEQIIELKDIISCLLNKIEEGNRHRELRQSYEKQRRKSLQKQKQKYKQQIKGNHSAVSLKSFRNLSRKKLMQQQDLMANLKQESSPAKLYFTQKKWRIQKEQVTKKHSE